MTPDIRMPGRSLHRNPWVDGIIKLCGAGATVIATAKGVAWVLHPTIVAAQGAINHPIQVQVDTLRTTVTRVLVIEQENKEAFRTMIEMMSLPPNSRARTDRARAYLDHH